LKNKDLKRYIDNVYTISYPKRRLAFEWNLKKNVRNFKKHCVWFEEAQTIWADPLAVEYFDPDHSEEEERYIRIGRTCRLKILLVVFCEQEDDNLIRIISARKVTQREKRYYEKGI